ncbi:MAG: hypothetical protein BGO10_08655 [Chlamydia sp. 32-24]|nr:MAG: hypothetical protein BGO10_08655 [Chlamydia sp. 32-24]
MRKILLFMLMCLLSFSKATYCGQDSVPVQKINIIGGGIIGALESYYAFKEAEKEGRKLSITVFDKGDSFSSYKDGKSSTNTSFNIVPSLTTDEILSVVPRGSELIEKLSILFSQPGGIRVDDVLGVNNSESARKFKESVTIYGSDPLHEDRTLHLLKLGKMSMDLWEQMYNEGDQELKKILNESNFHPCHEKKEGGKKALRDGYRIDLIYGIPNAKKRALNMKADYEKLGYKHCAILTPSEVIAIDPSLTTFCNAHSFIDFKMERIWKGDCVALWRPGGCIDTNTFLPKFYAYLEKKMGQYRDEEGNINNCFSLEFGKEVIGVIFDKSPNGLKIKGLKFKNGKEQIEEAYYVFCPGEAVGTLHHLGFDEPAYAAFAGPSLLLNIPVNEEQKQKFKDFSHWMEVHNEGIVLAWQARLKNNHIFIGVAGTKAFYGDKEPKKEEAFALNRNLVQLNMINDVLPEMMSIALGYPSKGKTLTNDDLTFLEQSQIAKRWVGRRAVAYDGFPTIGALFHDNQKVFNARCNTHLGSGGVSFGPGTVSIGRSYEKNSKDPFEQKILMYSDSRRMAFQ